MVETGSGVVGSSEEEEDVFLQLQLSLAQEANSSLRLIVVLMCFVFQLLVASSQANEPPNQAKRGLEQGRGVCRFLLLSLLRLLIRWLEETCSSDEFQNFHSDFCCF